MRFYCDFDFESNKTDRKSRSGWICFWNNGIFSWATKKQARVSLSTAEFECVALSEGCSGFQGVVNFPLEPNVPMEMSPSLYVDSITSRTCAENRLSMRKAKHIDVWYHFVKGVVLRNNVKIIKINLESNLSDVFTKALDLILFNKFWDLLGIKTIPTHTQGECWNTVLIWVCLRSWALVLLLLFMDILLPN